MVIDYYPTVYQLLNSKPAAFRKRNRNLGIPLQKDDTIDKSRTKKGDQRKIAAGVISIDESDSFCKALVFPPRHHQRAFGSKVPSRVIFGGFVCLFWFLTSRINHHRFWLSLFHGKSGYAVDLSRAKYSRIGLLEYSSPRTRQSDEPKRIDTFSLVSMTSQESQLFSSTNDLCTTLNFSHSWMRRPLDFSHPMQETPLSSTIIKIELLKINQIIIDLAILDTATIRH